MPSGGGAVAAAAAAPAGGDAAPAAEGKIKKMKLFGGTFFQLDQQTVWTLVFSNQNFKNCFTRLRLLLFPTIYSFVLLLL